MRPSVGTRFVSFLTDFGIASTAPAVCRGVMLGIVPDIRILDLTHAVRQFAVRDGAFLLSRSVPYLPVGVHLAVVDPGVGTERRPIAILTRRGDALVGPDNGLLTPAAAELGGIVEVRALENSSLWLPVVSSTFHGRDIFAPVAAHLAEGVAFASLGPSLNPEESVILQLPRPVVRDGGLDSTVIFIDTFGNCRLAGVGSDLDEVAGPLQAGRLIRVSLPSGRLVVPWSTTFGGVGEGEPLLYQDADYAGLALGVNRGSAAQRYGLAVDAPIRLEPA